MSLTVGSLFSGIGGLDLGLERAGMKVIWQSEIEPYCCKVLAKHWPHVPNLGDVKKIDWSTVERPAVLVGGYPCQPFSYAGKRAGEDDSRHLWPFVLDAIRNLRPRFAVMENVSGHLSLGFGRVLGDLAESGYDATWDCIPAAAVGAPHRRDRVFIVAHPHCEQLRQQSIGLGRSGCSVVASVNGPQRDVADTDSFGRNGRAGKLWASRRAESANSGEAMADAASAERRAPQSQGVVTGERPAELGERSSDGGPGDDWWAN